MYYPGIAIHPQMIISGLQIKYDLLILHSHWRFGIVTRVHVPWFFVSSQQRFGATDIKALGASQLSGLGQTVLQL